jgi:hypothetical protein
VTIPGQHAPTHEQVARADSLFEPETKAQAKAAVKSLRAELGRGPGAEGVFEEEQPEEQVEIKDGGSWTREALILTRRERKKVFGRLSDVVSASVKGDSCRTESGARACRA